MFLYSGIMGVGIGKGKNRATDAAKAATSSPLLDAPLTKATYVLLFQFQFLKIIRIIIIIALSWQGFQVKTYTK